MGCPTWRTWTIQRQYGPKLVELHSFLPRMEVVMSFSSYPASIDLENLSDEHQTAFVLYLRHLLQKKFLDQNRVLTDNLFGSSRRAIERWMSMERFPRTNAWEGFCQSEGATFLTSDELANLNQLYRNEKPQINNNLRPVVIDPYPQVVDIFFGRLKERWLLQEMLRDKQCRTLGIVGRAGIGKTALLRRLLRDITHGQWQTILEMVTIDAVCIESVGITVGVAWVDAVLDALTGMYLAATGISLSLDRRPTPQSKLDVLWDAIGDEKGLHILVLDNAERLLDGDKLEFSAQIFFEKLKDAPANLKVVTLSRRDLAPYLSIRHETIILDDGLAPDDALAFLRQRDPNNAARLRNANDVVLQQLAARVGYVPKALEAIVTHFLEDKFATIDGFLARFPGSDPMSELLLDVYQHLHDDTLRTLQIAATLNERATLDAITHVKQTNPQNTRLSCSQLIDLQLVENFERESGQIWLHALDQEYAYNLLEDTTRRQLHQGASGYFQSQAGNAMTARNLNDLGDHLTAFNHLMQAGAYDEAGRWYLNSYADRLRQLERNSTMIHVGEILTHHLHDPALQAGTAFFHSIPLFVSGRGEECLEQLTMAEECARKANSTYWLVRILSNSALIHSYNALPEKASAYIDEAEQRITDYQGDDATWLQGQILMRQMIVFLHQGQSDRALESARQLIEVTDDPEAVATAQGNIGTLLFNAGKYQEALEVYTALLETTSKYHFRVHHTGTVSNIGSVLMEMGKPTEALAHYREALQAATDELRDKRLQSQILNNLIEVYTILDRPEDAEESFHDALDLAERIGLPLAQSTALGEFGWALLQQRCFHEAETRLRESYLIGEQCRHPELSRFGAYLACVLLLQDKHDEASQQLEKLTIGGNQVHDAFILLLRAIAHLKLEQSEAALTVIQQTIDCTNQCLRELPQMYRPYFTHALALVVRSQIEPEAAQQASLVTAARDAFLHARAITDVPGILRQANLILELLGLAATGYSYMIEQQVLH